MAVEAAVGLADYIRAHSGACALLLSGVADRDAARAAMRAVRRAIGDIPHPEEPEDQLPSHMSRVGDVDDGLTFSFDAADVGAYDGLAERIVDVAVQALQAAGLGTGVLGPYTGDAASVRYADVPRPALLPFQLPDDFPFPDDVRDLVVRGDVRRGNAEFRSLLEPDDVLAFYEERLPTVGYELVERRSWRRRNPRWPVVFLVDSLLLLRDGTPAALSVTTTEFDRAELPEEAVELDRLGKTRVTFGVGERCAPDRMPPDGNDQ